MNQPPNYMPMPMHNQGYGGMPPPHNYPQSSYPPYYPPQMHPSMVQRYPPNYGPGMYMNPHPPPVNRPMAQMYDHRMPMQMYDQPMVASQLNQYEEQLYH